MTTDELRTALTEIKRTQFAADQGAQLAAELLDGRLRKVSGSTLAALKKQLRDFNQQTWKWKK